MLVFDFSKWRLPPYWIFEIANFFTVKKIELHHSAKFRQDRQDRSKRGRDMAIFRFFKMAAADILDFLNFNFLTAGTVKE